MSATIVTELWNRKGATAVACAAMAGALLIAAWVALHDGDVIDPAQVQAGVSPAEQSSAQTVASDGGQEGTKTLAHDKDFGVAHGASREQPEAGVTSPALSPADVSLLLEKAKTDRSAARELQRLSALCGRLKQRHVDPNSLEAQRWTSIAARCPANLPDPATLAVQALAEPSSQLLDKLSNAVDAGDFASVEQVASDLLRTSTDADELEVAALEYFAADRLRALAGKSTPRSICCDDAMSFRVDLSLYLTCSITGSCGPGTAATLSECAATDLCYPGMTMRQVIGLRRSPQEMALLEQIIGYVDNMRGQPRGDLSRSGGRPREARENR